MEGKMSLECQVLRKEMETLKSFFRHGMNTLCDKFYSRELILQDQILKMGGKSEEEQVSDLILMLENQVSIKSEEFYVIVECLKEINGMRHVAEKLEQTLQGLKAEHAKTLAQQEKKEKMREGRPNSLPYHHHNKESTVRGIEGGGVVNTGPAAMSYENSTPQQMQYHEYFKGHCSVGSEMNLLPPPPGTYPPNNSFYQSPQSEAVTSATCEMQTLYINSENHHHHHHPSATKGHHHHHHTHTEKKSVNITTSRESSAEERVTPLDLIDQTETEYDHDDDDHAVLKSSGDDVSSPGITMTTTTTEESTEGEETGKESETADKREVTCLVWYNNEKPAASSSEETYVTLPISPLPNTSSSPLSSPGFPTEATATPSGDNATCGIATATISTSRRSSTEKQTSCEECFKLRRKISLLEEEIKKIQKRENLEKLASKEQVESMRRELNDAVQLQQRHREQAAIISYLQIEVGLLKSKDKERAERERVLTEDLSRERTLRKREREEKERERSEMEETLLRANESSERLLRIKEETIQSLLQKLSRANSLQCDSGEEYYWSRDQSHDSQKPQRAVTAEQDARERREREMSNGQHDSNLLQQSAYHQQQDPLPAGHPQQYGHPPPSGYPQYGNPPPAGHPQYSHPPPSGYPQYAQPPPAGFPQNDYPRNDYPQPPPAGYPQNDYPPPPDGHFQYPQTPYPHPPPVSSQVAANSTTGAEPHAVVGKMTPLPQEHYTHTNT